jgi:type III secretion protein C
VPLLKDIPLIGNLFKTSTKSGKRMERLILLTPRIVTPDMRNVPAQAESPLMHISPQESTYELNNPMVRVPSAAKK